MRTIEKKYLCILVLLSMVFSSCGDSLYGSNDVNETIEYKGERFELFHPILMAFGKDTIISDLWFRTLNVDGDNKRIVRFFTSIDTTIFPLSNAVNNYTEITCYSLQVDKYRYLWFEDNFGTTVFDIDFKKVVRIKRPEKELTEIASTGAPIGVINDITEKDMRHQLNLKAKNKITILDKWTFKM